MEEKIIVSEKERVLRQKQVEQEERLAKVLGLVHVRVHEKC